MKEFRILFQKLGRMIVMSLSNLELDLKSYIVVYLWRLGGGSNGNAIKTIIDIKVNITALRNNTSNFDWSKLRLLKRELIKTYNDEKNFWKQKSRALWLLDKTTSILSHGNPTDI